MEFDLDYELAIWDGEPLRTTEHDIEVLKTILRSGLDDFHAKEIGIHNIVLDRLWKAGLVERYGAIKPSTRPGARWAPDYEGIQQHLSQDPEIYHLLQERARRKLTIVQTNRLRGGTKLGDCRVPYRASKKLRGH